MPARPSGGAERIEPAVEATTKPSYMLRHIATEARLATDGIRLSQPGAPRGSVVLTPSPSTTTLSSHKVVTCYRTLVTVKVNIEGGNSSALCVYEGTVLLRLATSTSLTTQFETLLSLSATYVYFTKLAVFHV